MPLPNEWLQHAPPPRSLSGNDQWNVFLSYRSINRPWVLTLYDVLREQGYKVFLDQVVLKPGDRLIKGLQTALETSQAGVLIWSKKTGDSDWVQREYETMETLASTKRGFVFIPVRLDTGEPPLFARNRIYVDFSSYPDGPNGGELMRLLYGLADKPMDDAAARFATDQTEIAQEESEKIGAAIANKDGDRILALFRQNGLAWRTSSSLGCKAAQGLTDLGRDEDAIAVLTQLETQFPKAVRPKQLRALALARRGKPGDLAAAQEILGVLYARGERDPETLGIYGRTWMDRYAQSGNAADLEQSRDYYAEAFKGAPDDYYTGINAAAKSVLIGGDDNLRRAGEYAAAVQQIVGTEPRAGDYWLTATIGEVFLIQKKYADAARIYKAAVAMARTKEGAHRSTWTQACRLLVKLAPTPEDRAAVRAAFSHLPDCAALGVA
jgi:TIR domain-containing protein/tetratricopeptide repeat protein